MVEGSGLLHRQTNKVGQVKILDQLFCIDYFAQIDVIWSSWSLYFVNFV